MATTAQNTAAINEIIAKQNAQDVASKDISELPSLGTVLNAQDALAMRVTSTGQDVKVTIDELRDNGVLSASVTESIVLSFTTDQITKGQISNIFGGLYQSASAQPLSTGVNIVGTHGRSKLMIVINAASDFSGTLTVTGTKVDRNTGVQTIGFSEDIIIDTLSTDGSSLDGLGNVIHSFTNCYITSEWYADGYTISTTDLNLSDVDVYGVAFNQFNSKPNVVIDTLDLTATINNTAAEFSGHAYAVEVVGSKVSVTSFADMEDPASATEIGFYRYRKGNIAKSIDTVTDGVFVDINFMPFVQTYYEAISFNLWAESTQDISVIVDGSMALDNIVYGETLVAGNLVYLKSDGKYWKSDNTSEATSSTEIRLILTDGVADDENLALAKGQYVGSAFTPGLEYVGTSGTITTSKPTGTSVVRVVSTAINATTRYFDPSKTWVIGNGSKVNGVVLSGNYLTLDNTTPFTPDADYEPATKKYVDDNSVGTTEIGYAISDETTSLTIGTTKVTFRMPFAMTLTDVRASLTTAPTGSSLVVDINESGTTILSTKLSIDATEKTSETAATPPVISDANLADDAEITIDIDQIGSIIAGAGLKIYLIGTKV